jgi:predicted Zn-dependent protease
MNLLAAICLLRSDRVADAEVALRDANLLDNRNCEVWAYQALLCLTCGFHRLPEAEAALQQTIRLGLCASPILRELATAFIAMDKLQTAEDLIRRALASEGNKGSSYTRKLLGDVLAGQQQAASAVNEYQAILDDEYSENPLKLQAAEQCFALLNTLGRKEEANTVAEILRSLKA